MPAKAVTPATRTITPPKKSNLTAAQSPKRGRRLLRFVMLLLLILAILGAAAAGAVHYRLVDLVKLDSQWGISKYPLVGNLFKQLVSNPSVVETEMSEAPDKAPEPPAPAVLPKPGLINPLPNPTTTPLPVVVDRTELNKQATQRQEEEQRRLVKVSRLYDGMKPEEAASILNELEDEAVLLIFSKMDQERVGKIMTIFDAKRSARLSNAMLNGKVTDD